jgi:hypothetical protein
MGLTLLVFGALALAAPGFLPPAQNAEAASRIGEVTGTVGGALIGIGCFAMLFGLLRWMRQA